MGAAGFSYTESGSSVAYGGLPASGDEVFEAMSVSVRVEFVSD